MSRHAERAERIAVRAVERAERAAARATERGERAAERAVDRAERAAGRGMASLMVLVADDQAEVRSALRLVIEQLVGYRVAAEAGDASELLALATATPPDVVLLDWELPEAPAGAPVRSTAVLAALREQLPGVRVVAMSARFGARTEAIEAGADGFVSKGDPPRKLIDALDGVR